MAVKKEIVKQEKTKNPTRQKVIVEQGRVMSNPKIEHKILYTEVVASKEIAKEKVNELKEKFKDTEGLSIVSFSL